MITKLPKKNDVLAVRYGFHDETKTWLVLESSGEVALVGDLKWDKSSYMWMNLEQLIEKKAYHVGTFHRGWLGIEIDYFNQVV